MVKITEQIIGGIIAFSVGVAVAFANYVLSRYILTKKPQYYASTHILRQFIVVAYLLILFLVGNKTPFGVTAPLIGGCLGITLPMFYFTARLVKLNDNKHSEEETDNG